MGESTKWMHRKLYGRMESKAVNKKENAQLSIPKCDAMQIVRKMHPRHQNLVEMNEKKNE